MKIRELLKSQLYCNPRLLGALMKLKPNWSRDVYTFLHCLQHGDHVLDVGANEGSYARIFSILTGPQGRVDAFEPVPSTYAKLVKTLQPFPQAHAHPFAVAERPGEVVLHVPGNDSGQASLRRHDTASWTGENQVTSHAVSAITLDGWVAQLDWPRIDFIKLDIEGAEMGALRGASQCVQRFHPLLFIEVYDAWLTTFGTSPRDLAQWLRGHGYDRMVVVQEDVVPLPDLEDSWTPFLQRGMLNLLAGKSVQHAKRLRAWWP